MLLMSHASGCSYNLFRNQFLREVDRNGKIPYDQRKEECQQYGIVSSKKITLSHNVQDVKFSCSRFLPQMDVIIL
jgi:hypothetical protein